MAFHKKAPEASGNEDTFDVIQQNHRHDGCLLIASLLPVVAYFWWLKNPHLNPWVEILILGYCGWWCVDRFVSAVRAAIFGFGFDPLQPENGLERITPSQAQRRIVLKLLLFCPSLVFAYAVLYWGLQQNQACEFHEKLGTLAHGLQLSFGTMTTIGYGTFAPTDTLSILVAALESGTALLNLGASLSALTGVLKVRLEEPSGTPPGRLSALSAQPAGSEQTGATAAPMEAPRSRQGRPTSRTEYRRRQGTNLTFTLVSLLGLGWLLYGRFPWSVALVSEPVIPAPPYEILVADNLIVLRQQLHDAAGNGWEVAFPVVTSTNVGLILKKR